MKINHLQTSFQLPCGATIANRLVKSAMTERISNEYLEPTEGHQRLYKIWADTGAGIHITGNVMIDPKHVESAGNVYFGDEKMLPKLQAWASVAKTADNHVWVQISHSGRQTTKFNNFHPLAPSAVRLKKMGLFGKPKVMTEADIQAVIKGFAKAAELVQKAGFTGVQIHSAHGYLLSQFLSPAINKRSDKWGGSLENRSRLLLTILREVRAKVGAQFPISVKLNSADFQRGGFSEEDSLEVVKMLEKEGIDLLEISGGTYEKIVFMGDQDGTKIKASTRQREAYFMDFAQKVRATSQLPLLVTGGFRSFDFCNEVLAKNELDFVGMARPFITNIPEIPDFLEGKIPRLKDLEIKSGLKMLDDFAKGGFYAKQLILLSEGKEIDWKFGSLRASIFLTMHELRKSIKNRKARKK